MAALSDEIQLQVGGACLLFFTDETGHETFADPNYPVFGLGGCAIISSAAEAFIRQLWRAMKAAHFGGADVPLHANAASLACVVEISRAAGTQPDCEAEFF
jgi:hypothetical protein